MKDSFICVLCIVLLFSCKSSVKVMKPYGEKIDIELNSGDKYEGELYAINEESLFLLYQSKIYKVNFLDLKSIYVNDYSVWDKKAIVMLPSIFINGVLAASIIKDKSPVWNIVGYVLLPLTIYAFLTGDPLVDFYPPIDNEEIDKLKLYCRYPQGLSINKLKHLLEYHHQKKILTFGNTSELN